MWEKLTRPDEVRHLGGDIPIHHRYTLGVAGERFFKAMRDEKRLLASRCPSCREAFLPPRMYCESCFEETADWIPVEGPGYLKSYTVLHRSLDEEPLEQPVVAAVVGWTGIRGGLVHRVGGVAPSGVAVGLAVEPVWAENRTGSLGDILHFRPAATK